MQSIQRVDREEISQVEPVTRQTFDEAMARLRRALDSLLTLLSATT